MIIDLTRKQAKALELHFQLVENAYQDGRKGMLIAQIRGNNGQPYMKVGFLRQEESAPLVAAATEVKPIVPYGYGIPAPQHQTGKRDGRS